MPRASRTLAQTLALAAAALLSVQAAAAQSILRDAETEALFRDMARPLATAAGLDPKNVDVVLVNDPSVNAFVVGGQAVYIHSGLITEASNANEVQGVIAHELGHITGGHALSGADAAKSATAISLLSVLVGAAAAVAGAGEAGMAAMMAGQTAAMGKYLAFSRVQEASADAAGATYLGKAGITGKGSIAFFKKLEGMSYRAGYSQAEQADWMTTHPLEQDRIAVLEDTYAKDPAWNRPPDPDLAARFLRARAKLYGYLAKPEDTLRAFPLTDTSVPAHYARAYAFHKDAYLDKALGEVDTLLKTAPEDPYFLELKGQILLEAGKPGEALPPLRHATELTNNQPLIATTFGHALLATEDNANFPEAERVLKAAVARDRDNPDAWRQLGIVYASRGDMPRARLASAEQAALSGNPASALQNAEAAMAGLSASSPDWLRAQDIAFEARAGIDAKRKKR